MKKSELENKVLQLEIELNNVKNELFKQEKVELGTVEVGELVTICNHPFKVIEQGEVCTVLLCNDFIAENEKFGDSCDYKESNVKKVCDEFGKKIKNEVGSNNICETVADLTSVVGVNELGNTDYVICRPMTFDEFRQYGDLVINEDLDDWYWLCSPWGTKKRGYEYSVAVVSPAGGIRHDCYDVRNGVRPICILKSNIFVSKGE